MTKGKHMVPVLNELGIDAATIGNHDFDFGVDVLKAHVAASNFPWMLANVRARDPATGEPAGLLGGGVPTVMLEHRGCKIGLMGLIEQEWLATLATIDEDETVYEDFVGCARRLAAVLKAEGADMLVAVTHMRVPNDERLAREAPELDLILGGHDHSYVVTDVNGVTIVKSGTDFRDLTEIKGVPRPRGGWIFSTVRHAITTELPEDPAVKAVVDEYAAGMAAQMDRPIGETAVDLDARFQSIRTSETNVGNFVTDTIRHGCKAEVAILNSGTLRADCVFPAGMLKYRDLVALLPMMDELAVIGLSGAQLLAALENGVSQYPKLEGRFPQVSGVAFRFDAAKPGGSRVLPGSVRVNGEPLDAAREYQVAIKAYLRQGKDGYTMFPDGRLIADEEDCPVIPTLIRNQFKAMRVLNVLHHSDSEVDFDVAKSPVKKAHWASLRSTLHDGRRASKVGVMLTQPHNATYKISPRVEDRIVCLNGQSTAAL